MKLDLEFHDVMPPNVTPLEAITMVKCLDEDGKVTWFRISTHNLNLMESLGMMRAAIIVLEDTVRETFIADSDDDEEQ